MGVGPQEAARGDPCPRGAGSLPPTRHPAQLLWTLSPPSSAAGRSSFLLLLCHGVPVGQPWGLPALHPPEAPPPQQAQGKPCPSAGRALHLSNQFLYLKNFLTYGKKNRLLQRTPACLPSDARTTDVFPHCFLRVTCHTDAHAPPARPLQLSSLDTRTPDTSHAAHEELPVQTPSAPGHGTPGTAPCLWGASAQPAGRTVPAPSPKG